MPRSKHELEAPGFPLPPYPVQPTFPSMSLRARRAGTSTSGSASTRGAADRGSAALLELDPPRAELTSANGVRSLEKLATGAPNTRPMRGHLPSAANCSFSACVISPSLLFWQLKSFDSTMHKCTLAFPGVWGSFGEAVVLLLGDKHLNPKTNTLSPKASRLDPKPESNSEIVLAVTTLNGVDL